ncbi:peptidoglycan-binding domain-containing protein [Pseudoxanthomonas sp.]|uniref:peptidoglycan-binding domain-containing protein n=1 Tax=Pseudoxanthomonas sp. TaxID=1871049 RepID=UPI002614306F|nr:peptidoglycan-binding domain-containing protein [Pseudoxanthomonas sp.]WDS35816.1 MAG: peptidoglycan-binding domain-containing protein [Pseudoxanthomonas sp.]
MPRESTITTEQLHTLYLNTELGGNAKLLNHFSYAEKGNSSYSFGLVQFDVGNNSGAQRFLKDNGFSDNDITQLSKHGGLTRTQLDALDTKLQAIPQDKLDQFTNSKLDTAIERVDDAIERVRAKNPAAADAIVANPELQLAMADYDNQFGSMGNQFVGFLAGEKTKLQGGTIQAGDPPSRADVQTFIESTKYGIGSPKAVQGRDAHFQDAMDQLGIAQSPGSKAPSRGGADAAADGVLVSGERGESVKAMQEKLAGLSYTGTNGKPLNPDADFGPGTRHAVEQFQRDHGLTADGKAGPKTLEALEQAVQAKGQATTTAEQAAPSMASAGHADNGRYRDVLGKLESLEQQRAQGGLPALFGDRQQLENAAGQVVFESRASGLTQVDSVLARPDGQGVFAVQGQLGDPASQRVYVDRAQAVGQDLQASTRQLDALASIQEQTQAQIQQAQPTR